MRRRTAVVVTVAGVAAGLALPTAASGSAAPVRSARAVTAYAPAAARGASVDVSATVEPVVFGATDGLPRHLTAPRATATVLVYAQQGRATVVGSPECTDVALAPRTVVRLTCEVRRGTVTVRVTTPTRTYVHHYPH